MGAHGEFMWATRLVLERWSDEEFPSQDEDKSQMIHSCTVLQYTCGNRSKLTWVRRCWPVPIDGEWTMNVDEWEEFDREYLTNDELLPKVDANRHYFQDAFGS